ncbi:SagB/ThcOx family dehydrogenase [Actinomyces trachealis]|uniref:SagB/ThcOx family dehydrogenase n=1 Tax=Actinomyces trachealis TaxID=2763540 RepID=UPI0018929E81|nr:SagB/ThcOx family dehydrogenase [Actinomyces trachealis]
MIVDGSEIHGANLTKIVYGDELPDPLDCSEAWFEASKVHRESMGWDNPGVQVLRNSRELQVISSRGAKSYDNLPRVDLGPPKRPEMALEQCLLQRRSADEFAGEMMVEQLAGLLRFGAGTTDTEGPSHLRTVPSAGALHPSDLYFYARNVDGLEPGIYYYLPQENRVVLVAGRPTRSVSRNFFNAAGTSDGAVLVLICTSFWRTRFKYGQRGMRFALIEAGHLAQNLLLLASAYRLPARALGGFVDDEVNGYTPHQDGVDTAVLYALAIG